MKACWKGARGLGLVPCRAQRALCRLRDGFANADRCVLAVEQHAREVAGLRVILQDKRLRKQPFRKVKDRRRMVPASVFGTSVATLRAVLLVQGLTRTCVHGEPMFFAMKFCHCWRAADFAFAFAHHFYLPPALPGHFAPRLPGFAFKQRWFLHQRINSYNVVTWPLTAGSHWRCFWIGGRRRNLHSFFIRIGARDFYCRDCRVDLFDRQSEHDQHCSRDPDNSDQSCGMVPFHTETMATPAMAMTPLPLLSIRELNDEVLECRIVLRLAGVGRVWNQPRKNNPSPCRFSRACETITKASVPPRRRLTALAGVGRL
jgi:hypothetical protein